VGFRSQPAGYPAINLLVMSPHSLNHTGFSLPLRSRRRSGESPTFSKPAPDEVVRVVPRLERLSSRIHCVPVSTGIDRGPLFRYQSAIDYKNEFMVRRSASMRSERQ